MLELCDIQVHYGEVKAVKGISLQVNQGKIVTLIGANGAGKSTTLRTISGLLRPSEGSILFDGAEISEHEPHEITGLGVIHVPEGRMLLEDMTVRENLLAGAFYRQDRSDVLTDLNNIETRFPILSERHSQKARTLSGGERQMLAVGRAMMARPKVMMLDEPSLGLAPKLVDEMFKTVSELRDEGTTILLVEQNAYGALAIADYAYVMRVGEVVVEEDAKSLLTNKSLLDAYLGEA
ncbi:MAG: ABC transporter ATP-binding protein [Magnetovibrio sp.]|nr:ABC transporter ATP-binding protein [Magnetovibrio sp.]